MLKGLLRTTVFVLTALQTTAIDLRLNSAIVSSIPINGISTTPSNRTFLLYARVDGSKGPTVVEYANGSINAFPTAEWNNYTTGKNVSDHFVRVNAQRIGPDGNLYLVDTGSPGFGQPVIQGGVRLIQINLQSNNVSRIYNLDNVTYPLSLLDDVRFNGNLAYLTDAGVPGIIVLNRSSGQARRIMNDTFSTRGFMPASGDGKFLQNPLGGKFFYVYADQLEVSPDGRYFYYQAVSGGMHRIETRYLNDTSLNDTQLEALTEPYAMTSSCGGTAIDANGTIYASDTDTHRIMKITSDGTLSVFIDDPRLLWVDAMWIDSQNRLYMPAAQLNRGLPFNNGSNFLVPPYYIYTVDIGVGPPTIDHA